MAKKEVKTDLWVYSLLQDAGIDACAQGSNIKEIDSALKTASKRGTGKEGYPEYTAVVKDFLLVIEDKASIENHIKNNADGKLDYSTEAICGYAVNGAVHYALHLLENTSYKKIIAFGVSGDEKRHRITPIYIDNPAFKRTLPDVDSFVNFTASNISEYYTREVLGEPTDEELQTPTSSKKPPNYTRTCGATEAFAKRKSPSLSQASSLRCARARWTTSEWTA